jgi:hypothetical protein
MIEIRNNHEPATSVTTIPKSRQHACGPHAEWTEWRRGQVPEQKEKRLTTKPQYMPISSMTHQMIEFKLVEEQLQEL